MKPRTLIAMILALAALCAIYFIQENWKAGQQTREAAVRRLFEFAADEVTRIRITQIGEPSSIAERGTDGAWKIVAPNASIEPFNVLWDRVAMAFAGLENFRTIEEKPESLAVYGLEEPALEFEGNADGQAYTLRFGDVEPTQIYRYAQLNGGPVFLVSDKAGFFELNRPLGALRHTLLVRDREDPLVRLEYARILSAQEAAEMENPPPVGEESEPVVLARADADSPWRLVSPVDAPADQERVDAFAAEIQFGQGSNFIDNPEDLSLYDLNPARARITVTGLHDQVPQTLYVGDADLSSGAPKLFARKGGQDAVFQIAPNLVTVLPKTLTDFREGRLFTGEAKDIVTVELQAESEGFLMNRVGDKWVMVDPVIDDIDSASVSIYLSTLKQIRAQAFPEGSLEALGLDQPKATITLTDSGGATTEFRLSPDPSNSDYYLATQDTGQVAQIYLAHANQLLGGIDRFRSRNLFRFPGPLAEKVEFQYHDVAYKLEKVHDRWVLRAPLELRLANQSDAEDVLRAVNPIMALKSESLEVGDPAQYGLDTPLLRAVITCTPFSEDDPPVVYGPIIIGAACPDAPDQHFAQAAGREGVFRVSRSVLEIVDSALDGFVPRVGGDSN